MTLRSGALATMGELPSERRLQPRRAKDLECYTLASFAAWLIEREPFASVIVDRHMRVLLANAAASEMLERTRQIELRGSTLSFSSKAHRAVIAKVLNEQASEGVFQIRAEGRPETARIEAIGFGPHAKGYLMLTVARPASTLLTKLRRSLRLTPAESQIAFAIARGSSQRQIARMRRASINTIKTQVRCIYQKAGVRSQAGLASKVAEIR
ncbi:helix-turn-helix transcriptional regulator [Steroidobacter cummioxidans]|uniref:helix-turn-helix transcriptional regulator n=1 Tax=Steroidobacter cummioxidans TaxID=1803913 RepID=UPI000E31821E|nr:LuxR C-terminal-related transcriptional regulator [Steroidobacter cummioxidans]